jgi:hypothetical protein
MPTRVKPTSKNLIVEKEGEVTVSTSVLNLSDYFLSAGKPPEKQLRGVGTEFTL